MSSAFPETYLVRHGETEWSLSGRHTGRSDIPLTANGEAAARKLAGRLAGLTFSAVWSSPSERARKTCALAGFGSDAVIKDNLAEWDYGAYEGITTKAILAERPGWQLFRDGCLNGEFAADVGARADAVIHDIRDFFDRTGFQEERGGAVIEPAVFDQMRCKICLATQGVFFTDDGREAIEEFGGNAGIAHRPRFSIVMHCPSVAGRGCPLQPVVDRFAEPILRNRRKGDALGAAGIGPLHIVEKIGRRLRQVAARAEIKDDPGTVRAGNRSAPEGNQCLAGFHRRRIEAHGSARRVV